MILLSAKIIQYIGRCSAAEGKAVEALQKFLLRLDIIDISTLRVTLPWCSTSCHFNKTPQTTTTTKQWKHEGIITLLVERV